MGVSLEASFDIGVAIGDKLDSIDKALSREHPRPIFLPFVKGRTGPGVVSMGRPPTGRIWNILSLTLLGSDDHTTVAGTVGFYVDTDPDQLSVIGCVIPNLAIPSVTFISSKTLWAHSTGEVVANFLGMPATQEVVARISVAEWREKDMSQVYTN